MASYVVGHDKGRAAIEWPQRRDCYLVGPTPIVGNLMGCCY